MLLRHFTTTAAACLIALLAGSPAFAKAKAKPAAQFVPDAIAGDLGEIELGQLAQTNAGSAGVKSFGQTLVTDHTAAKDEMTGLAQRMKYKVPTEPKAEARNEFKRLQAKKNADFDREFVRYMVSDHRKDIAAFEAQAGGKGEVADLAKKQLPTLRKHLQIAEQLGSSPGEGKAGGTMGKGTNSPAPRVKPSGRM